MRCERETRFVFLKERQHDPEQTGKGAAENAKHFAVYEPDL
jgi:hypothetical protein